MAKAKKKASVLDKVSGLEILALIMALFFMHSVTTNAHDLIFNKGSYAVKVVEGPYMLGFVLSVLIVIYYFDKRKALNLLSVIILTILAVSGYFWLFALKANS